MDNSNPHEYWPQKCGYPDGVGSYNEFKKALKWFEDNSATFSYTVFRGEPKHYKTCCSPSIARYNSELTRKFIGDNIITDQEVQAALLSCGDDITDNVFFKTQHFGGQTRLLDVSTAQNVALYFACNSNFEHNGYFYIFFASTMLPLWSPEVETLDSILGYYNFMSRSDVCYLIETYTNMPQRMNSQFGAFLCWQNPIDKIPGVLFVIKIKNTAKKRILQEIAELGWTSEKLFQDLYGNWLSSIINKS